MIVRRELAALLRLFGGFRGVRFRETTEGLLLFDGGTESAYENYALFADGGFLSRLSDRRALRAAIRAGLDFFAQTGRSHIWPVWGDLPPLLDEELAATGLALDDCFCGMTADVSALDGYASPDARFEAVPIVSAPEAARWADAAWYGFDADEPAPESFAAFAAQMAARAEIALYALRDADAEASAPYAATGMVAALAESAGIYYVATDPQYRRKGLGMRAMKALADRARDWGYEKLSLLATPAGRPLYLKCGFRETGSVKIRLFGQP